MAGRDQPILDLLPPEPAPPGAFATVTVRSLGEATFHEVLSAAPILFGSGTEALGLRAFDEFMLEMPV